MASRRLWWLLIPAVLSSATVGYADSNCFQGTRRQARAEAKLRLGLVCRLFCNRCGCKGGPGLRKQDGFCATKPEIGRGVCGEAPQYDKCVHECAPINEGCTHDNLPAPIPPVVAGPGLDLYGVTGEDSQGRRAAFDIIIISEGLTWKYGTDQIDKLPPSDAELRLLQRLSGATDIIAAGTASSEGDRKSEEKRAFDRARKLAELLQEAADPKASFWLLNLGQYLAKCVACSSEQSAFQRPVFFAVVKYKEPDTDLDQALRMALTRRPDLPAPERYSRFDLILRR